MLVVSSLERFKVIRPVFVNSLEYFEVNHVYLSLNVSFQRLLWSWRFVCFSRFCEGICPVTDSQYSSEYRLSVRGFKSSLKFNHRLPEVDSPEVLICDINERKLFLW